MNEIKLKRDYAENPKWVISKMRHVVENGDITDPKYRDLINTFLRNTNYDTINAIAEFVSSIFGIDRANLLSKSTVVPIRQARSMWWMALHFLLKKSCAEIMILTSFESDVKSYDTIRHAIQSLQDEMNTDFDLRNKWGIIREMVKLADNPEDYVNPFAENMGYNIRITAPKNVKIDVKYE